ncbi:MAG: RES family NAD+ phosphorylase [Bacteroidota bacterium]
MEVYRVSSKKYARELSASGSANRWNIPGEFVIYASSSHSLATLELVIHRNAIKPEIDYRVMIISVANTDTLVRHITTNDLPKNWRKFEAYSELQIMGSTWYTSRETLILKVPSVVIPHEHNYIINTKHEDFNANVQLVRTEDYFWDDRLL